VKIDQHIKRDGAWELVAGLQKVAHAQLALVFGGGAALADPRTWAELAALYPGARVVGCSTAGEISGGTVSDDGLVATGLAFDHGRVELAAARLTDATTGSELGVQLARQLPPAGLVHALVLSEGLKINGSALVAGMVSALPPGVAVTGGLSGDGARFERTAVCLDGPTPSEQVVAIGLYGTGVRVGVGSRGGWDPFGPERRITRSAGNVLFELDGEPALDLYKRYLAEHAAGLPASGLLFPLAIRSATSEPIVRTILGVDEVMRSLTFAGDVPEGYRARLMRANFERLVDGASSAAQTSLGTGPPDAPDLAILISCVGRKLVLKQRTEEEVEAVRDTLGASTVISGFYSYGEIAPFAAAAPCELHNQTMTITTISER